MRQITDSNESFSINIYGKFFNLLYNLGIVVLNILNILLRILIFILRLIDQILILIFNLFNIINESMKKIFLNQVQREAGQALIIIKQKMKTVSIIPKYECTMNGRIV